jgi:hypothetical protein
MQAPGTQSGPTCGESAMDILSGIGAINALLRNTTGLVQSVRASKQKTDFSHILRQVQQQDPAVMAQKKTQWVDHQVNRFIELHDANSDKRISQDESGLEAALFKRLDADGDGALSADELRNAYSQRAGGATTRIGG